MPLGTLEGLCLGNLRGEVPAGWQEADADSLEARLWFARRVCEQFGDTAGKLQPLGYQQALQVRKFRVRRQAARVFLAERGGTAPLSMLAGSFRVKKAESGRAEKEEPFYFKGPTTVMYASLLLHFSSSFL